MYRLIEFLRSVYVFLLFIVLEGSAFYIYANSNSYVRAKMLSYTSSVVSSVNGVTYEVADYFHLRRTNRELLDRISYLEEQLLGYNEQQNDSMLMANSYFDEEIGATFQAAKVVYNTINRKHNYIIINRGLQDGVRAGMGVVTFDRAMVGFVLECGDRSSVVMSMLNTRFRTSGRVEGDSHAGSIYWGGQDKYRVKMRDLSKYVDVKVGDRIVSTDFSQIFPSGVVIGRVAAIEFDSQQVSYNLDIDIETDISGVDKVLVVNYNSHADSRVLLDRIDRDFDGDYADPMELKY